jgi:spermidine synthase
MNGLHLIGDLTGCRCDPQLLLDGERFRAKCLEMVAASGLTTMDATFHQFEGSGFTGTVVLAESHLAIHTWPERQGLTLDVYVCNYSADNSLKADACSTGWSSTSSRARSRSTRCTGAATC